MQLKDFILKYERYLSFLYSFFFHNRKKIKGENNIIERHNSFIKKCIFEIRGKNNVIVFGNSLSRINNCRFIIHGSNNQIELKDHVVLSGVTCYIEDDNNVLSIGRNTWINPEVELACIEGTSIFIGEGCMFSSHICLRTGDSHSVLNENTMKRTNPSKDIKLEDHVWVGNNSIILKGSHIGKNSIVATGAIVTGKYYESCSVIAGNPAKIIKSNVNWDRSRKIEFEKK